MAAMMKMRRGDVMTESHRVRRRHRRFTRDVCTPAPDAAVRIYLAMNWRATLIETVTICLAAVGEGKRRLASGSKCSRDRENRCGGSYIFGDELACSPATSVYLAGSSRWASRPRFCHYLLTT